MFQDKGSNSRCEIVGSNTFEDDLNDDVYPENKIGQEELKGNQLRDKQHSSYFPSNPRISEKDETVDVQDVIGTSSDGGRAPSPSSVSSITSGRRLEWDSGADVGYGAQYAGGTEADDKGLSTIERLALAQGRCNIFPERSEPEGTSRPSKAPTNAAYVPAVQPSSRMPLAHSTPVDLVQIKNATLCTTASYNELTPVVTHQTALSKQDLGIQNEMSEVENSSKKGLKTNMSGEKQQAADRVDEKDCIAVGEHHNRGKLDRTPSCSLTDLRTCQLNERLNEFCLQRSQSDLNLEQNCLKQTDSKVSNRRLGLVGKCGTHSASSSSIATVIHKNSLGNASKSGVRYPDKKSIGTQLTQGSRYPGSSAEMFDTPLSSRNGRVGLVPCNKSDRILIGAESGTTSSKTSTGSSGDNLCGGSTVRSGPNHEMAIGCEHSTNKSQMKQVSKCIHCPGESCKGAHKKRLSDINTLEDNVSNSVVTEENSLGLVAASEADAKTYRDRIELECRVVESGSSSSNTHVSWTKGDQVDDKIGSSGIVGSANSFEYVPGHMLENRNSREENQMAVPSASGQPVSQSGTTSSRSGSKSDTTGSDNLSTSCSSTLTRDLEKSVRMLQKLVEKHKANPSYRKKFVRSVVDRIVSASYVDDQLNPSIQMQSDEIVKAVDHGNRKNEPEGKLTHPSNYLSSSPPANSSPDTDKFIKPGGPTSNDEHHSEVISTTSGSVSFPAHAESSTGTREPYYSSSLTSSADRPHPTHWRNASTHSEKVFEKHKQSESGEEKVVLQRFCETERENQLSWIQFEINHLMNLQRYLKNNPNFTRSLSSLNEDRDKVISNHLTGRSASNQNLFRKNNPQAPVAAESSHEIATVKKDSIQLEKAKEGTSDPSKHKYSPSESVTVASRARQLNASAKSNGTHKKHLDLVIDMKVKAGDRTVVSKTEKFELQEAVSSERQTPTDSYATVCHVDQDTDGNGSMKSRMLNMYTQTTKKLDSNERLNAAGFSVIQSGSKKNPLYQRSEEINSKVPKCCCDFKKELDLIKRYRKLAKENKKYVPSEQRLENYLDKSSKMCEECHKSYVVYKVDRGRIINKNSDLSSDNVASETCVSTTPSTENTNYIEKLPSGRDDDVFVKPLPPVFRTTNERRRKINQINSEVTGDSVSGSVAGSVFGSETNCVCDSHCRCHRKNKETNCMRSRHCHSHHKNKAEATKDASVQVAASLTRVSVRKMGSDTSETEESSHRIVSQESQSKVTSDSLNGKVCPCCKKVELNNRKDLIKEPTQMPAGEVCPCCYILKRRVRKDSTETLKPTENASSSVIANGMENSRKNCMEDNSRHKQNDNQPTVQPKSLAYIVAFDPEESSMIEADENRRKSLEVIKIKVHPKRKSNRQHVPSGSGRSVEKGEMPREKEGSGQSSENVEIVASVKTVEPSEEKFHKTLLQELLLSRRPDYVQKAEERRQCVAEMAHHRERQQQERRNMLANVLAPPPSAATDERFPSRRIFNQKQMKDLTKRHCRQFTERRNIQTERKRKQDFRTNKLMAEIFAKKLQKRVLKGEVNLSNSISVISSVV